MRGSAPPPLEEVLDEPARIREPQAGSSVAEIVLVTLAPSLPRRLMGHAQLKGGLVRRIKGGAVQFVERHGGIVNQFVGDEILALCGIPTAYEDDPVRAVRAAMEIREMARAISPEVEERVGEDPVLSPAGITVSYGTAPFDRETMRRPDDIVQAADADLYRQKGMR